MDIQLQEPTKAQPLDDEGDPKGNSVILKPGKYRLNSMSRDEEGKVNAWLVGASGRLYEVRDLRLGVA